MYKFLPVMLLLVGYVSTIQSIVILKPSSRGESISMKPEHGTLILTITSRTETLLQQAVADNNYERAYQLLTSNEDPNVQNHHGFTALHFAAALGYADIVHLLLSHNANPNIQDNYITRITPLACAIYIGNADIIKDLIEHSANVETPDIYGYTPLHIATTINNINIVTMLLEAGADINAKTFETTTAMYQSDSRLLMSTPLHEAAMHGHTEMIRLLLQKGACTDVQTSDNKTPLDFAFINGFMSDAHLLLQHCDNIENAPEQSLICAAVIGDCEMVDLLIAHGFDVNKTVSVKAAAQGCSLDITPLCAACQNKNAYKTARLLLEHGAVVDDADSEGTTPLINAVKFTEDNTTILLIEHRADINKANSDGNTPLHWAALLNKADIVRLLVKNGAHINAQNNQHKTPLDIALYKNNHAVVEFFKNYNVNDKLSADNRKLIALIDHEIEQHSLLEQCFNVITPITCSILAIVALNHYMRVLLKTF